MEAVLQECLLCLDNYYPRNAAEVTPITVLGRQLRAVFVLRDLLHLPPEKLTELLGRSGGNHLHESIIYCDPCQELVEEAFSLLEQKIKINRKLKKVQEEVVKKVKAKKSGAGGKGIAEETRQFVRKHDFGLFETPFLEGDLEAERQLERQRASLHLPCVGDVEIYEHDPQSPGGSDTDNYKASFNGKRNRVSPRKRKGGACPTCHKVFTSKYGLRLHVEKKTCVEEVKEDGSVVVRSYQPGPLGKVLDSEIFIENGQTLYRCALRTCGKVLSKRNSFLRHKSNHTKAKVQSEESQSSQPPPDMNWLTCEICHEKFLRIRGLKIHYRRQHPEAGFPPTPPERMKHSRQTINAGQKTWRRYLRSCPHCPYTGIRSSLESHIKRVHEGGEKPLHCEHCGQGVSAPQELKLHQAQFHFICGVKGCTLQLQSQELLHAHQVGVHGREVNLFRCDTCGKFLTTKSRRERHRRQVHQCSNPELAEQHVCDQCGKSFALKEYLHNHVWHAHKKLRKAKSKTECSTDVV